MPLDVLRDAIQPFPTFSEIYVAALKALRSQITAAGSRPDGAGSSVTGATRSRRLPPAPVRRPPELAGQTVVVIGGSSGMGLETARRARAEGADVILGAPRPGPAGAGRDRSGRADSAVVDATDPAALGRFFDGLPATIDHVMVTGPGPYYARLADLDQDRAHPRLRRAPVAGRRRGQHAVGRVRPGGTLLFLGGTGGRQPGSRPVADGGGAPPPCPP